MSDNALIEILQANGFETLHELIDDVARLKAAEDTEIENVVHVTAAMSPYTVQPHDDNIVCDTSGGAVTVMLPASPETGRAVSIILDTAGNALTINGNGNNIGGAATVTKSGANDVVTIVFNGVQWNYR